MAATVSAWGKPGAWALDSEQHEQEEEEQQLSHQEDEKKKNHQLLFAASQPLSDFPSLSAAAATTTKTKKKKPQAVSLSEFTTGKTVSYGSARTITPNELLLSLPTGPRERSAEELERSSSRLGGGFRSSSNGGGGGGREDYSSRWGRGGGSSDSTDEPRRNSTREPLPPSKADEVDDWGAAKKSAPPAHSSFDRRDRDRDRDRDRGSSGAGFFDSHSRADESDSWLSKKSLPLSEPTRRFDRDRRSSGGGFDRDTSNGGALSDNWGATKREQPQPLSENGRPKLVLQPRSQAPAAGEAGVVPNKTNPFGAARPREEVLADKGQDWKKIDEQLESTKAKEITSVLSDGSTAFGKKPFSNGRLSSPEGHDRTEKSWKKMLVPENSPPSSEVEVEVEVEADKDGDGDESEN